MSGTVLVSDNKEVLRDSGRVLAGCHVPCISCRENAEGVGGKTHGVGGRLPSAAVLVALLMREQWGRAVFIFLNEEPSERPLTPESIKLV